MDKRDFDYPLPEAAIAQAPLAKRRASRLLALERASGRFSDRRVTDLPDLLSPDDVLVFNDTRVIPARLHGHKRSGGAVEIMLERILGSRQLTAKVRANRPPKPDTELIVGDIALRVIARAGELYTLALAAPDSVDKLLDRHGHMPLPPYIRRADDPADRQRYQTVWARHDGAVAAPTAGLHFDRVLLNALSARGIRFAAITLHVGSGTYQRLREGDVRKQHLHAERLQVGAKACAEIAAARAAGGRVVAVGTTAVRGLEAAARAGSEDLVPYAGETRLFLQPGDTFHAVDAIFTNFHEPQSSLLMLIAAFAGREQVLAAYAHALAAGYRFLSYGDAMLIA